MVAQLSFAVSQFSKMTSDALIYKNKPLGSLIKYEALVAVERPRHTPISRWTLLSCLDASCYASTVSKLAIFDLIQK